MEVDAIKSLSCRWKWFIGSLISLRPSFPVFKIHAGSQSKKKSMASHVFHGHSKPSLCRLRPRFVESMLDIHRFQTLKSHRWDLACSHNMTRPINRREKESGWRPEAANYRCCVSCFLVRPKICLVAWKVPLLFICRWISLLSDSLHQWLTPHCY